MWQILNFKGWQVTNENEIKKKLKPENIVEMLQQDLWNAVLYNERRIMIYRDIKLNIRGRIKK